MNVEHSKTSRLTWNGIVLHNSQNCCVTNIDLLDRVSPFSNCFKFCSSFPPPQKKREHLVWIWLIILFYLCEGTSLGRSPLTRPRPPLTSPLQFQLHCVLEPIYIKQQHVCDVTLNGLQSHFQVTDKFDASVDTDAWCNSTGQNPYIWFGSDLAAPSQTLDVNGPLSMKSLNG